MDYWSGEMNYWAEEINYGVGEVNYWRGKMIFKDSYFSFSTFSIYCCICTF